MDKAHVLAMIGIGLLAGCGSKSGKESVSAPAPSEPAPVEYTIQIRDLEANEVAHITEVRSRDLGTEVTDAAGKVTSQFRPLESETLVYVQTILEMKHRKPIRLRRQYERAETLDATGKRSLGLEGKTVLIEKKKDGWRFRYDGGGDVGYPGRIFLLRDFGPKAVSLDDELKTYLPKKRVKVGESWEPDAEFMAGERKKAEFFKQDPAKVVGQCKLERVYSEDGHQFGVLEFRFEFPSPQLTQVIKLEACIDGTSATFTSNTEQRKTSKLRPGDNDTTTVDRHRGQYIRKVINKN